MKYYGMVEYEDDGNGLILRMSILTGSALRNGSMKASLRRK